MTASYTTPAILPVMNALIRLPPASGDTRASHSPPFQPLFASWLSAARSVSQRCFVCFAARCATVAVFLLRLRLRVSDLSVPFLFLLLATSARRFVADNRSPGCSGCNETVGPSMNTRTSAYAAPWKWLYSLYYVKLWIKKSSFVSILSFRAFP